jgi:hypothetical protein
VIHNPPTSRPGNPNLAAAHRNTSTMSNGASPPPPGTKLEYWQLNLPSDKIPSECPVYLQNISDKDKKVLSTRDADFPIMTWPIIRAAIDTNALDRFARLPSDLRRYIEYNHHTKVRYTTVGDFILREKLGWPEDFAALGAWFEDPRDWSVQWNDWPYGIEERIVHLCVWTKFPLPNDREKGDISDETRQVVEVFVDSTFGTRVPKQNVSLGFLFVLLGIGCDEVLC